MLWCSFLGAQDQVVASDSMQIENSAGSIRQQNVTTLQGVNKVGVSPELKEYFMSLLPERDTTYTKIEKEGHKDKFFKRFSFHTNLLGWALLLPNAAVEIDLSQTPRNHYSILLHGMFNGKGKNTFGTSFIFNARGIRIEGRKYWRTGRHGAKGDHYEYEKLITDRDDNEFNADSTRGWFYNTYHKVRRNVFSGRTVSKPRDWRAYYLGVSVGVDDWNIAFGGDGKQGEGIFAGLSAGWSVPIFPQQFPKEGSLDLELGLSVGVKAVRYEAYSREADTGHYIHDPGNSQPSWKICPFPFLQDVHVSLVWRMRGIKNKVDRSLIDDYEKKVEAFKERTWRNKQRADSIMGEREHKSLVAPLEIEIKKVTALLPLIEKADSSGKAAPMLRLALNLARRDSADMVTLGSKAEQERERKLIAMELNYYSQIALGMVDQRLLPQAEKGKKSKKAEKPNTVAVEKKTEKPDTDGVEKETVKADTVVVENKTLAEDQMVKKKEKKEKKKKEKKPKESEPTPAPEEKNQTTVEPEQKAEGPSVSVEEQPQTKDQEHESLNINQ